MPAKRYSVEQILAKRREAEKLEGHGRVAELMAARRRSTLGWAELALERVEQVEEPDGLPDSPASPVGRHRPNHLGALEADDRLAGALLARCADQLLHGVDVDDRVGRQRLDELARA